MPRALEQVVRRALASARDDRFPTARDMVTALEAARAPGYGLPRSPTSTRAARWEGPRRSAPDAADTSTGGLLPEGEQRRVTIVASTLSEYDALVGRLVPEDVERLVGGIREEAAGVAARHGGTLNQFAGDELLLLFGVPIAHEDDAVRAVRAALELHARVRALSESTEQRGGPRLRLHTGIDTGRVIVSALASETEERAYRILGVAAQVAPRLASHAGVDEVWASPECARLIGPAFETAPQSALVLRDRKEPLIPFHVLRASGSPTGLVPDEGVGLTAYVGRTVELATLQRSLEAALQGEGRFVTVTGEAGMGKSRLLHEFRKTLDEERVSCLLGRCQSDGGGVPYLPFVEILRDGLRLGEPGPSGVLSSTVARIREIGAELEEFIPIYLQLLSIPSSEFRMPRHVDGDTLRLAIQEALAAILTLSARRRPVVVLLEDAHWADDASRSVLEDLAGLVSGCSLLVAVTTRPGYGAEWKMSGQHTPIPLVPLDPSSLSALLRSFLRVRILSEELGALLRERTGGNPFFLEEICMALLEEGAIRIEGGEARTIGPLEMLDLPDSIEAVIRARLDRLDRNARDVLRLASVVGREFTRGILEHTVTDGEGLPEALDALKAAGLVQQTRIVPEAVYRFKHVLTREVAYASLLEHQRRELHGRVGARIEQLGEHRMEDHLERLAHHFSRAEAWGKAVEYGIRSADRAGGLAQYADALQILERTQRRLINLPEDGERQEASLEILLRQERLCETLGLRGRQRQIIDELIRLLEPDGDPAKLAEVYLRQGDLHALLRRFEEGEEALQRSLLLWRELSDEAGERKVLRSLGLLRWYEGRHPEALTCIEAVIAMDRERDDVVALVGDITSLATVLKAMGDIPQALQRLQEGVAIAEEASAAGSPVAGDVRVKEAYILNTLAVLYREAGDLESALEHLDRADEIAEVKRLPVYLSYNRTLAAHICLQQGRIEESLAGYREATDLTRKAGFVPGLSQTLRIQGEVLVGLSRFDEALPCLEEAAALFAQLEDRDTEALMWTGIASAQEGAGNDAAAISAWKRARALRKADGDRAGELEALEGLGAALRRHAPDPSPALACYHDAAELAETLGRHAVEGRLRNVVGILEWGRGGYAQALRHYERALTLFRMLGDPANAGLMLNSIGVTLTALERTSEAKSRLDEAIALHRETGQLRLEGHALAALGDLSARSGDRGTAGRHYGRSLEIRRRIGDRRGEGWMLYELARNEGAGARAGEWTARASRIAEGCGDHELADACLRLQRTPTT
jgi:class 3 adenylate cyclase/tetratricopeptide (TPR) repeat protein